MANVASEAPKLGNTPNHRHALVNWSDSAGVALDIPRPIPESLARQGVCGFQVSNSSAEEPGCGFATKRSYLIAHFTSSSTPAQNDKWCACTDVSASHQSPTSLAEPAATVLPNDKRWCAVEMTLVLTSAIPCSPLLPEGEHFNQRVLHAN
ncbi:predicted protein [Histoplasma capsulatum H143]|uniref:Uncharacterized protein n=1 Tax=Ajellomyces capsulatus (strain H143) TaxID=544712 RepID=C6HSD0_AJECH|nr:predicted protein [Histoplasma capsulatum H143]